MATPTPFRQGCVRLLEGSSCDDHEGSTRAMLGEIPRVPVSTDPRHATSLSAE